MIRTTYKGLNIEAKTVEQLRKIIKAIDKADRDLVLKGRKSWRKSL